MFRYFQREEKEGHLIKYLPISESESYVPSYALCTDSHAGGKVIGKINMLIKSSEYKSLLRRSFSKFMPDSIQEEFFKKNNFK